MDYPVHFSSFDMCMVNWPMFEIFQYYWVSTISVTINRLYRNIGVNSTVTTPHFTIRLSKSVSYELDSMFYGIWPAIMTLFPNNSTKTLSTKKNNIMQPYHNFRWYFLRPDVCGRNMTPPESSDQIALIDVLATSLLMWHFWHVHKTT